ncbi:LysM peptidoglycan-binding domain-containing protein [Streptomyces sp. N2-109]|uniref:LysM peptidoglycan-binding domain-containing protein n=1 Tax=Streptomyces gossypii TaxID=2883101 RepID=A0ABT2JSR7_9ACTN|nr:LysM peptidoglycan-binding domain-containing protein [Streptomyces gossypii]MCT2590937.1 LysM peptidoglycan-binding domain-containing protein [Streptomyces gossypii]
MTTHAQNMTVYTVKQGDTLSEIAERFGTTVEQLVKWNHIEDPDVIGVGRRLTVAKSDSPQLTHYTVKRGDTLSEIAERFGTTVEQLVKWNHIEDPDVIGVGQRLIVAKSVPASAA